MNGWVPNIIPYKDIDYLCQFYFGKSIQVLRRAYHKGKLFNEKY
jgi:hypothetical protein